MCCWRNRWCWRFHYMSRWQKSIWSCTWVAWTRETRSTHTIEYSSLLKLQWQISSYIQNNHNSQQEWIKMKSMKRKVWSMKQTHCIVWGRSRSRRWQRRSRWGRSTWLLWCMCVVSKYEVWSVKCDIVELTHFLFQSRICEWVENSWGCFNVKFIVSHDNTVFVAFSDTKCHL